jgi:hypothetical protein
VAQHAPQARIEIDRDDQIRPSARQDRDRIRIAEAAVHQLLVVDLDRAEDAVEARTASVPGNVAGATLPRLPP